METLKNAKKNVITKKVDNAILKTLETNILKSKEKINKDKIRVTTSKEKNFIYKFQLDGSINEKEQKKKRNKLRRNLKNIVNTIIVANMKKENLEVLTDFLNFYKSNYILNDFTLKSITNSSDLDLKNDLELILNLCQKKMSK